MKIVCLLFALLFLKPCLSQNKKEQISVLNSRVDSLCKALNYEKETSAQKSEIVNKLEINLYQQESDIKLLKNQIEYLHSELVESKAKMEENSIQIINLIKEINSLNTQLGLKNDSLNNLKAELEILKPKSKPSTNSTPFNRSLKRYDEKEITHIPKFEERNGVDIKIEDLWYVISTKELVTGIVYNDGSRNRYSTIYEETYFNGKRNGLTRCYFKGGVVRLEANYKDGRLDGYYREWHQNGQLKIEAKADFGRVIYTKCWNEDGTEKVEFCYKVSGVVDL